MGWFGGAPQYNKSSEFFNPDKQLEKYPEEIELATEYIFMATGLILIFAGKRSASWLYAISQGLTTTYMVYSSNLWWVWYYESFMTKDENLWYQATFFIAIGAASRTMMLLPMTFLRPARSDGLGHSATTSADTRRCRPFRAERCVSRTSRMPSRRGRSPSTA